LRVQGLTETNLRLRRFKKSRFPPERNEATKSFSRKADHGTHLPQRAITPKPWPKRTSLIANVRAPNERGHTGGPNSREPSARRGMVATPSGQESIPRLCHPSSNNRQSRHILATEPLLPLPFEEAAARWGYKPQFQVEAAAPVRLCREAEPSVPAAARAQVEVAELEEAVDWNNRSTTRRFQGCKNSKVRFS